MLTGVVQIAVDSNDLLLLTGPAQGLQLKGQDRSGLCWDLASLSQSLALLLASLTWHPLGTANIMLNHYMIFKWPLEVPKPVTRCGAALDGQKDIVLGGRGRAQQGTDLSPSSTHPQVLWPHTKQKPCFLDTSPLHLGLKTMYNSQSRVAGGSTAFEDPSTWPPSKVLLLFITSWCYYWYLMILFWHYSCMSDICPEPEPDRIRCCATPWEN